MYEDSKKNIVIYMLVNIYIIMRNN